MKLKFMLAVLNAIMLLGAPQQLMVKRSSPARQAPLEQEKRGSVSGVVIGPDSEPIAKASVVVTRPEGDISRGFPTLSDAKGAFKLESLAIGTYELEVRVPALRLLRPFTMTITVRDSVNTIADVRLRRIQQCEANKLGTLTRADEAEIIRLMLAEALVKKEIPSYPNLVVGNEAILSTKNIESHRVSNPADLRLLVLSPAEIQNRANQRGDLMYLEFEKFAVEGSCVAVELSNLWADGTSTIETGKQTLLGEGAIYYAFRKQSGRWIGEYITGWIS